jgi:hypothetical protein
MPGTVVQARTTNPGKDKTERLVALVCTSDSADGSVPDTDLINLSEYALTEVITTPSGGDTAPEDTYRIQLVDANGVQIFISGTARSATASEREGGHITLGYYPPIDNTITFSVVDKATLDPADIGNSNIITAILRFVKR